jgi:hypothetical protein
MAADHLPAAPRRHGGGRPLRAAMARALPGDGTATVPVPGETARVARTACVLLVLLFAMDPSSHAMGVVVAGVDVVNWIEDERRSSGIQVHTYMIVKPFRKKEGRSSCSRKCCTVVL